MQSWKFAAKKRVLTIILRFIFFCHWLHFHVILIPCYCIQCYHESAHPHSQADKQSSCLSGIVEASCCSQQEVHQIHLFHFIHVGWANNHSDFFLTFLHQGWESKGLKFVLEVCLSFSLQILNRINHSYHPHDRGQHYLGIFYS